MFTEEVKHDMDVEFRTRMLRRCFEEYAQGARRWDPNAARRYISRVNTIYDAESFDALKSLAALRLHELDGALAGQWAMTLVGRWRLVVLPPSGGTPITVWEVSNHYGD